MCLALRSAPQWRLFGGSRISRQRVGIVIWYRGGFGVCIPSFVLDLIRIALDLIECILVDDHGVKFRSWISTHSIHSDPEATPFVDHPNSPEEPRINHELVQISRLLQVGLIGSEWLAQAVGK